jgi:hypothetical protein
VTDEGEGLRVQVAEHGIAFPAADQSNGDGREDLVWDGEAHEFPERHCMGMLSPLQNIQKEGDDQSKHLGELEGVPRKFYNLGDEALLFPG